MAVGRCGPPPSAPAGSYGRSAVARSQYLRYSFLITFTPRLQLADDALIAATHTGFAFAHFLVQLLTRARLGRRSRLGIGAAVVARLHERRTRRC
jgi:hypothetical protein